LLADMGDSYVELIAAGKASWMMLTVVYPEIHV
jgi:hypothetical protein